MSNVLERRVGIFGGSFDPIHVAHLVVAQDVLDQLSLDRVLFVPARRSPTSPVAPRAPGRVRLRMVEAALKDDSRFEVRDLEILREGPSYTIDSLRVLTEEEPGTSFFLLLGADQWADFSRWRSHEEIARLATLVVMTRAGSRAGDVTPSLGPARLPHFVEVQVTRLDVSSTDVRDRIVQGHSTRYLVPAGARRIIEAENLYL